MALIDIFSAHASVKGRTQRTGLTTLLNLMRSRRALRHLDAAALKDIGITRCDAIDEARRPIWDAPEAWRR